MKIVETTDLDTLARLNRYVHEPHVAQQPDFFKPYDFATVRAFFAKIVGTGSHQFLLAELDGEAIGYVWIDISGARKVPFILPIRKPASIISVSSMINSSRVSAVSCYLKSSAGHSNRTYIKSTSTTG